MENQLDKSLDNEMETTILWGVQSRVGGYRLGYRVLGFRRAILYTRKVSALRVGAVIAIRVCGPLL